MSKDSNKNDLRERSVFEAKLHDAGYEFERTFQWGYHLDGLSTFPPDKMRYLSPKSSAAFLHRATQLRNITYPLFKSQIVSNPKVSAMRVIETMIKQGFDEDNRELKAAKHAKGYRL